ncbi:MAG: TRAP transporter TatT component family protein, partial [Halobacteriovoraceae bacterium]|nr:TRAP transporter TatT component family protein [Halobacteriovoraceae bacterium]
GTFLVIMMVSGCSTMRSVALKTAAPLFMESMSGIEAEGNWEQFKNGIPANLTLVDGLLAVRPYDSNLLMAAIKGNAGYAFGVAETLYLHDKLQDESTSLYKDQAIAHYSKAFEYGLRYLEDNDLSFADIKNAMKAKKGIPGLLENQLSGDQVDLEAMLFSAQALGGLVNLQRDNLQMVSLLPVVKGIFDWVCEAQPNIAHGMCDIFYGSYEAGRPAMLGGNPQKGKEIFEKLIAENPHNWLARVAFLEYYSIPQYDEDVYNRQKKELLKYEDKLKASLNYDPKGEKDPAFSNPTLRLYQAIAIKRFQIIRKYEKDIF